MAIKPAAAQSNRHGGAIMEHRVCDIDTKGRGSRGCRAAGIPCSGKCDNPKIMIGQHTRGVSRTARIGSNSGRAACRRAVRPSVAPRAARICRGRRNAGHTVATGRSGARRACLASDARNPRPLQRRLRYVVGQPRFQASPPAAAPSPQDHFSIPAPVVASVASFRRRSPGFSIVTVVYGSTLSVSHTLEPITLSWPITVRPPKMVALA